MTKFLVTLFRVLYGSNWQATLLGVVISILQYISIPGFDATKFIFALQSESVLTNPDFWTGISLLLPYLIGRIWRNGKPNPQLSISQIGKDDDQ